MKTLDKSVKKLCYLSMSQHLGRKIHKGHNAMEAHPWKFSDLTPTQRTPYLHTIIFPFLFLKPQVIIQSTWTVKTLSYRWMLTLWSNTFWESKQEQGFSRSMFVITHFLTLLGFTVYRQRIQAEHCFIQFGFAFKKKDFKDSFFLLRRVLLVTIWVLTL